MSETSINSLKCQFYEQVTLSVATYIHVVSVCVDHMYARIYVEHGVYVCCTEIGCQITFVYGLT